VVDKIAQKKAQKGGNIEKFIENINKKEGEGREFRCRLK